MNFVDGLRQVYEKIRKEEENLIWFYGQAVLAASPALAAEFRINIGEKDYFLLRVGEELAGLFFVYFRRALSRRHSG